VSGERAGAHLPHELLQADGVAMRAQLPRHHLVAEALSDGDSSSVGDEPHAPFGWWDSRGFRVYGHRHCWCSAVTGPII